MANPASASAETLFEVQQLQNGGWDRVSGHGSRSGATNAAEAFVWRNRQAEVRIVQTSYDSAKGLFVDRVVFRHKPPDPGELKLKEQESAYSRVAAQAKKRQQEKQRVRKAKAAQRREKWGSFAFYTRVLLLLVLLCGGAVAALLFLRSYT